MIQAQYKRCFFVALFAFGWSRQIHMLIICTVDVRREQAMEFSGRFGRPVAHSE